MICSSTVLGFIAISAVYFKFFKIIRRHQHQVQANESCQNFGQPTKDILK